MIEVLEPGLLTTVQDLGRPGWGHLGVPTAGAADPWSMAVANALLANAPGVAALEVTLTGPRLRAHRALDVAIAGADLRATAGGHPISPGRAVRLEPGEELTVPGPPVRGGARAYVAVAGGIDVPAVLGSRSTCLGASFGGIEGRSLRAGDRLTATAGGGRTIDAWPGEPIAPRIMDRDGTVVVRVLPRPSTAPEVTSTTWIVSAASDRMGLRLDGDGRQQTGADGELPSHGVVRGTIQVPPDGRPIILHADHQPTGGYPVAGVVITADLPSLGQLAPGDRLRFERVDLTAAQAALVEQRAAWAAAVAVLRADAGWDDLWRSAGG